MIFVFIVGGYHSVFWIFRYHAEQDLMQRLEENRYTEDEQIVLAIPLSLPYPIVENDYERTNGEFEYNGEHYKLVKRKVEDNVLYLVCVRNVQQNKLQVAMSDLSKSFGNLPSQSKTTLNLLSKLFKDFQSPAHAGPGGRSCLILDTPHIPRCLDPLEQSYPVVSPPPKVLS
jgi:hypothetical protein